jgi:hypothetical protein
VRLGTFWPYAACGDNAKPIRSSPCRTLTRTLGVLKNPLIARCRTLRTLFAGNL